MVRFGEKAEQFVPPFYVYYSWSNAGYNGLVIHAETSKKPQIKQKETSFRN